MKYGVVKALKGVEGFCGWADLGGACLDGGKCSLTLWLVRRYAEIRVRHNNNNNNNVISHGWVGLGGGNMCWTYGRG